MSSLFFSFLLISYVMNKKRVFINVKEKVGSLGMVVKSNKIVFIIIKVLFLLVSCVMSLEVKSSSLFCVVWVVIILVVVVMIKVGICFISLLLMVRIVKVLALKFKFIFFWNMFIKNLLIILISVMMIEVIVLFLINLDALFIAL